MCRNHPFIDFYTFDNVCRKIGQCYTGTFGIKRHTVQKVANGITRQAINRKVVVRTHATFLTHFHTSSPINDGVQALRSVYQRLYVHGIDSICPFPQLLRLALAVYLYSIQANRTFLQDEIHLLVRTHVNGLFFILITYHRHNQNMLAYMNRQLVMAFLIGITTHRSSFQCHCSSHHRLTPHVFHDTRQDKRILGSSTHKHTYKK